MKPTRTLLVLMTIPLLVALAGCMGRGKPATDPERALAHSRADFNPSFQDTVDGGDDPWVPGCHLYWSQPNCAGTANFLEGDGCTDATHLKEWTNSACHPPQGDTVVHDCDAECKKKGFRGGGCVQSTVECASGNHRSDKCECIIVDPTVAKP